MTRTAPHAVHRPADKISQRTRSAMGLPKADPTPARKALLAHIEQHGPMLSRDMLSTDAALTPQLVWLKKEGYISSDKGGSKNAVWDITAIGRRWIAPASGELVKAPTRAFAGCATESPEIRWPDVRGGASVAFEIASRGME